MVALFQRDISTGQQRQATDLAIKHGILDVRPSPATPSHDSRV